MTDYRCKTTNKSLILAGALGAILGGIGGSYIQIYNVGKTKPTFNTQYIIDDQQTTSQYNSLENQPVVEEKQKKRTPNPNARQDLEYTFVKSRLENELGKEPTFDDFSQEGYQARRVYESQKEAEIKRRIRVRNGIEEPTEEEKQKANQNGFLYEKYVAQGLLPWLEQKAKENK